MSTPYLSEVRIFSFDFAPKGWAQCNGQLLSISQNQALFSLLGTTFGGNGTTTFGLPNLMGRTPTHFGTGPSGNAYALGQVGGEAAHTLTIPEMPVHNHQAYASSTAASVATPANNFWSSGSTYGIYGNATDETMAATAIGNSGGSQSHNNMSPYLTVNICIALTGIFPSRN